MLGFHIKRHKASVKKRDNVQGMHMLRSCLHVSTFMLRVMILGGVCPWTVCFCMLSLNCLCNEAWPAIVEEQWLLLANVWARLLDLAYSPLFDMY